MRDKLVSVIIPVYNAEKYLQECVDSVLAQTYSAIEIIIIDDGSRDKSGSICDCYAEKDSRIKVFHQGNKGAAGARKRGVIETSGEYICFVDADDKIASNMIEYFINHIGNCDLITSGCECEYLNKVIDKRFDAFSPGIYKTKEEMSYIFSNMIAFQNRFEDGLLPFLVNKMYKAVMLKQIINDINEEIVYAEDRELLFRYVLKCSSIVITNEIFYFYRCAEGSIMRSVNLHFMHDLNALYISLKTEFENYPLRDVLIHQLQLFIASRICRITEYMGFDRTVQMIKYVCPFYNKLSGKKVVLYGAGKVGMSYYRQFHNNKEISMLLWVDKNWDKYQREGLEIEQVEMVKGAEFDCIIIAVTGWEVQNEIRNELTNLGIPNEKIWWEKPISTER